MNTNANIEILPEDRVKLTNDQQNLIELAFAKQVPVEDTKYLERVQSNTKDASEAYAKILEHFSTKYGVEFGRIYLAAIIGGEEGYNEVIQKIEEQRAKERVKKETQN